MAAEVVVSSEGGAHRDCFSLLLESNKKHKVKGECRIKIQTNWRKKERSRKELSLSWRK